MKEREDVERVARAICAESCAFRGEPPCYTFAPEVEGQEWHDGCSEPGCIALAQAAICAMERRGK
jgi:hypothetical protein